jgi:transcriptional regulator with XRE-family HTH domain
MSRVAENSADIRVGKHLRAVRRQRGLTVEQLAQRTGLSRPYLSNLERDHNSPTVTTLNTILEALGVSLVQLFQEVEVSRTPVVREQDRQTIELADVPGVTWEILTPAGAPLELFRRRVLPGGSSGADKHTHPGNEAGIIISGHLRFWLDESEFDLGPGDSIFLSGQVPHRYANLHDEECVAIWASTEPGVSD